MDLPSARERDPVKTSDSKVCGLSRVMEIPERHASYKMSFFNSALNLILFDSFVLVWGQKFQRGISQNHDQNINYLHE